MINEIFWKYERRKMERGVEKGMKTLKKSLAGTEAL